MLASVLAMMMSPQLTVRFLNAFTTKLTKKRHLGGSVKGFFLSQLKSQVGHVDEATLPMCDGPVHLFW